MAAPAAVNIAVAKIRVNCSKFRSNAYSEHLSSMVSPILTICNGHASGVEQADTLNHQNQTPAHTCLIERESSTRHRDDTGGTVAC